MRIAHVIRKFIPIFLRRAKRDLSEGSFLRVLVGERVSNVSFPADYTRIEFGDQLIFTCYVQPVIYYNRIELRSGMHGYLDVLRGRVGHIVWKTEEKDLLELNIIFEDDVALRVSLLDEDQTGPEAAMLKVIGGQWNVWRSGETSF